MTHESNPLIVARGAKFYNRADLVTGGVLGREAGWIKQIAKGDAQAFECLCRDYQRRLYGYLYKMLGNHEATEEVINDVLIGIWKGAAKFHGDSKVSTWIFGIARNKALAYLNRRHPTAVSHDEMEELTNRDQNLESGLVERDLVQQALRKLTHEHREVIYLTFFMEFSYKEIAEIVDCPLNTVKTRMFHAKQRLRQVLTGQIN